MGVLLVGKPWGDVVVDFEFAIAEWVDKVRMWNERLCLLRFG